MMKASPASNGSKRSKSPATRTTPTVTPNKKTSQTTPRKSPNKQLPPGSPSNAPNNYYYEKVYVLLLISLVLVGTQIQSFFHAHNHIIESMPFGMVDELEMDRPELPKKTLRVTTPRRLPQESLVPPATPDQIQDFYTHHYQKVHSLANDSSFLVWNTRSKDAPFEPWFQNFDDVYHANAIKEPNLKSSRYIFWGSICFAAREFAKYRQEHPNDPLKHVLFFRMNENWGGMSETIPGKTAEWITNLIGSEWKKMKCQNSTIWEYINHPDTLVTMTTQFQIFDHPKVHSLPLGIKSITQARFLMEFLQKHHSEPRTQLLMVNSKPRAMRLASTAAVLHNFQGMVENTFGTGDASTENYYREMMRSKFIFSPGGLGFDCYRHWEALYMGTIPVLEHLNRTDGWFRTFDDLPVAWIDSYENLTPEFLDDEYNRIMAKAKSYKYEKLTMQWWVDFIQSYVPEEIRNKPYETS